MNKSITLPSGTVLSWDESKWGQIHYDPEANYDVCNTFSDPSVTIDVLGLSTRLYNVLIRHNIRYIVFLEEVNVEDLKSLRHFPESGIDELKERFSDYAGFDILEGRELQ